MKNRNIEIEENRVKVLLQLGLSESEFNLIADMSNGSVKNFKTINFKGNIIGDVIDSMNDCLLDEKYNIDGNELINKLNDLTDNQMLQLMIEVDVYWDREDIYQNFSSLTSPREVLKNNNEEKSDIA